MAEVKIGNKYEWIKGEDFGKEDIVKNPKLRVGQMNFIEFVSGRRCSVAIAKEYINLIATAEELEIDDPEAFVRELAEKEGNPIAEDEIIGKQPRAAVAKPTPVASLYKDILDKIKTYEDTELSINLTVSLPKTATLEVLLDAYGDELSEELNSYITDKITGDVKEQVGSFVNNFIESLTLKTEQNED